MNKIVEEALQKIHEQPLNTGGIRKLSSKLFRQI